MGKMIDSFMNDHMAVAGTFVGMFVVVIGIRVIHEFRSRNAPGRR
ncbi:MAG: hypothetical protein V4681_01835 [Patescibacteria group bacterium]